MKYYELHTKVYLLRNLSYYNSNEFIGNLINYSMLEDEYLANIHKSKGLKGYSFSGLYPTETDFVYKKDKTYDFMIRSYDKKFIYKLKESLNKQKNDHVVVLTVTIKEWKNRLIGELQTYTPTVLILKEDERKEEKNKYWIKNCNIELLMKRIQNNLLKKYKEIFNEELKMDMDMIKYIEITNKKPCVINYKGIKLLGNKFRIVVDMDKNSQKLANLAMVAGILEKNSSLGCGFCKGVYIS